MITFILCGIGCAGARWCRPYKNAMRRLNCHFPFRILIFKRERALIEDTACFTINNAMRMIEKTSSAFSFYCFKMHYSPTPCSFRKAINADWLSRTSRFYPRILYERRRKTFAKWKFPFFAHSIYVNLSRNFTLLISSVIPIAVDVYRRQVHRSE